jgi:hypothetical protein
MISHFLKPFEDYVRGAHISFQSKVAVFFSGTEESTNRAVMLKSFALEPNDQHRVFELFIRELECYVMVRHPAILHLRGWALMPAPSPQALMIFSLPTDKTLGSVFKDEKRGHCPPGWTATAKTKAVFGIACAMSAIHSANFIHRDLEPSNIFCEANWQVRVANIRPRARADEGLHMSLDDSVFHAPEMWSTGKPDSEYGGYSHKVDQYAFALTLYLFFKEATEFDGTGPVTISRFELSRRLENEERWVRPEEPPVPDRLWSIITRCWATEPASRPEFSAIVEELANSTDWYFPGTDPGEFEGYKSLVDV